MAPGRGQGEPGRTWDPPVGPPGSPKPESTQFPGARVPLRCWGVRPHRRGGGWPPSFQSRLRAEQRRAPRRPGHTHAGRADPRGPRSPAPPGSGQVRASSPRFHPRPRVRSPVGLQRPLPSLHPRPKLPHRPRGAAASRSGPAAHPRARAASPAIFRPRPAERDVPEPPRPAPAYQAPGEPCRAPPAAVLASAAASALPRPHAHCPPKPVRRAARRPRGGGPEGHRRAVAAAHWSRRPSLTRGANGRRPGRGYGFGFFPGGGGGRRGWWRCAPILPASRVLPGLSGEACRGVSSSRVPYPRPQLGLVSCPSLSPDVQPLLLSPLVYLRLC